MRIYVTEFTKLNGVGVKPILHRSGFGDDFSLSLKDFLLYFYGHLVVKLVNCLTWHFGVKEFKLTIHFKF